jgi:hypothetical protein
MNNPFARPAQAATATQEGPPKPTISKLDPNDGPTSGGTAVVITGTGFESEAAADVQVHFGGIRVEVESASDTEIKVVSPALNLGRATGAAKLPVTVSTPEGTSDAAEFTYTD